ncbi:MlaD family protein [Spirochaetota bacterium]
MAYQFKKSEKAVGAFIIIGLAIVVCAGVFLARKGIWSKKKYTYYTYYDSAEAIEADIKVLYKGLEIGKVSDISFRKRSDRFRVGFYVYADYISLIKTNSVAQLHEAMLGTGTITITKGTTNAKRLYPGGVLLSSDDEEGRSVIKEQFGVVLPPKRLDKITFYLYKLVDILSEDDGPVMALLGETKDILTRVDILMADATSSEGSISALLKDDQNFYNRINNIMLSLDETMKNMAIVSRNLKGVRLLGGGKKAPPDDSSTIDKNVKYDEYR